MSRLDDLIDLIRTTNEVYFITAPGRVRTAFILVDDIVELALKSYLQEQAFSRQEALLRDLEAAHIAPSHGKKNKVEDYLEGRRSLSDIHGSLELTTQPQQDDLQARLKAHNLPHWTVRPPDDPVRFPQVIREIKAFYPGDPQMDALLDHINERHKLRNALFHDPSQSGLTIDDEKCLKALCDLFTLIETLFPQSHQAFKDNKTVRCQIGVLRLKLEACHSTELEAPYNNAIKQAQRGFRPGDRVQEHNVLHSISDEFIDALRNGFDLAIAKLTGQIAGIDKAQTISPVNQAKRSLASRKMSILQDQLAMIDNLVK